MGGHNKTDSSTTWAPKKMNRRPLKLQAQKLENNQKMKMPNIKLLELARKNPEDDRLFNKPTGPRLFQ